jgi:3-hydroxyacyl-CoA dehydrogenase
MLVAGQQLDARQAWVHNLADHLSEDIDEEPPLFLENPGKRDWTAFPRSNWRQRWLESNRPGRWFLFRGAERILRTRIPEEMPAPAEMLGAIRGAYELPSIGAGLENERQAAARIVGHPALHHLLRLLEHREHLRAPSIAHAGKTRIRTVGVIGSGTAALALLLQCIINGHEVVLRAENEMALGAGLTQIVQLLQAEVQRGAMTPQHLTKTLGAVRGTFTWTHFDKLHLILDTTGGPLAEKQRFYQAMEQQVPGGALVVPVTGLYRIADLRHGLRHPERVIGMHLIEPWSRGSVAEIVVPAGAHLNGQRVREWAVGIGKCCLHAPDDVGGIVMRVWLPGLNEAAVLVKEGVPIDRIDLAMRRFGMTYGPLEWMDRLGIQHIASLVSAVASMFADRLTFESGFALMAGKRWLGKRVGAGFYRRGWRKLKPHADAVKLWQTQSQGEPARPFPVLSEADAQALIQRRLVTLMILEALRCLDEGLVKDSDDLDCAMCLTGWATHRGGPIGHARQLGVEALAARCAELAQVFGERFAWPAALAKNW